MFLRVGCIVFEEGNKGKILCKTRLVEKKIAIFYLFGNFVENFLLLFGVKNTLKTEKAGERNNRTDKIHKIEE